MVLPPPQTLTAGYGIDAPTRLSTLPTPPPPAPPSSFPFTFLPHFPTLLTLFPTPPPHFPLKNSAVAPELSAQRILSHLIEACRLNEETNMRKSLLTPMENSDSTYNSKLLPPPHTPEFSGSAPVYDLFWRMHKNYCR